MRRVDQAFEQLRRANPVPDPAVLLREEAIAAVDTIEGREQMETVATEKKKSPPSSKRGWSTGLVAAALVLVLGSGTVVFLTSREPTPVEIAEAYIEARNDYDVERARQLVADDFRTGEAPDGFVDITGMGLAFAQHEAYGFRYSDVDCSLTGETPQEGATVACDYLWTTELHRIGGHPATPERLTLVIDNGRIQRITRSGGAAGSFWNPFYDGFLGSEHREFRSVVGRSLDLDPEAVREVVDLLPQYLDLYEEWVNSQED